MRTERDSFQKGEEICESCREHWETKGLPLRRMVTLPNVTKVYHSEVAVCEYCDGEPIVKFALLNKTDDE